MANPEDIYLGAQSISGQLCSGKATSNNNAWMRMSSTGPEIVVEMQVQVTQVIASRMQVLRCQMGPIMT